MKIYHLIPSPTTLMKKKNLYKKLCFWTSWNFAGAKAGNWVNLKMRLCKIQACFQSIAWVCTNGVLNPFNFSNNKKREDHKPLHFKNSFSPIFSTLHLCSVIYWNEITYCGSQIPRLKANEIVLKNRIQPWFKTNKYPQTLQCYGLFLNTSISF